MTALVIAVIAIAFVAWKAAKLALIVALVSLAVCALLATAIALTLGGVLRLGLSRRSREATRQTAAGEP